ncbi:MAG TPA: oligosaccharide flippase family protein [Gammaproteobacteria bacterium]|nr:oligosaccharide flippase family protein [Gammaproteobacteria bacterium]
MTLQPERRILTNTAVLGIGEAVGQVAGVVFVIACGRAYGTGVLGWYSMGMAVGAIAAVLVSLGTDSWLLRELSRHPEHSAQRIGGTLPYQLALSALVLAVVLGLLFVFVDDPAGRWIVAAITVYHVVLTAASLLLIPFRARQIMWPSAAASAAKRAGVVLVAVPLILFGISPSPVFAAFPVTAVLIAGIVFVAANRFLGDRLGRRSNSPREQRALYTEALPFFGTAALDALYGRLGLLVLAMIAGEESTGIYSAADRLLVVVSVFRVLFIAALYPAVAHFAATDRARALELSNRCMRLMLVLTVPAAGLIAIFHREIISLLFGAAFEQSALVLLLLTPLLIIRGINGLWSSQAAAVGLQRSVVRIRALTVALFAIASAVFVTFAGAAGLALALLLSECVYAIALRVPLARVNFLARVLPVIAKPLIATLAGGVVYVATAAVALPLRAVAVAAVVIAAIFLTGAVRAHDLKYLQSILRFKSSP